jgi:hypothetical protein
MSLPKIAVGEYEICDGRVYDSWVKRDIQMHATQFLSIGVFKTRVI